MIENTTKIIYEMETKLLKEIVAILRSNTNLELAQWKMKKYKELTGVKVFSQKLIEKDIKKAIKIGEQAIKEASIKAVNIIDTTLAGNLPVMADPRLKAILTRYEQHMHTEMFRLGAKLMREMENVYIDILEKSTMQVLAGHNTLRDAIRETSGKWTREGIKTVKDKANRQWTNEAYTQMTIRTGVRQSVTDIQLERLAEYDHDLIEIDSHVGARPLCAIYQGRVFSRTGQTKGYTALSETSYGEPAGLFGINCGHRIYPYIPGTKRTYDPVDSKQNKEVYAESQEQRYYERQIRYYKRIDDVYGEDHSKQIAGYENKIESLGRTRRTDREEIY